MSNFDYCSIIWHFCGKKSNSKIEKIQERALKVVFDDFDSDACSLRERLGTKSVFQLRLNRILIEIFKTVHGQNPSYLNSIFKAKITPYNLRDPSKLIQSRKDSTTYGLRSVNYVGSKMWNELTPAIKSAPDVASFKAALNNWDGINLQTCETFFI